MKPVFSSGSRGFRVLSASADRHEQLLTNRPGVAEALRLEDLVDLLGDDPTELLVMELATGKERTIDGIAVEGRIALGHPKTREAMRAGLAMYFETLDDPGLMETARKIVAELGLDHFFNIQLVGEHVIEINPRISTIVYQEDLNLPYLGVKHALGEISEEELGALALADPRLTPRAPLFRPGRMGRVGHRISSVPNPHPPKGKHAHHASARRAGLVTRACRKRDDSGTASPRVTHCPVNTAGVPWQNVLALRRRGVDARLVVFERYKLHPEADESPRPARRARPAAARRSGARSRACCATPTSSTSTSGSRSCRSPCNSAFCAPSGSSR